MRGHHQEDDVADDVVVAEPVAVFVLGLAQHRQQIRAVLAAALLDPLCEVVLQQFACLKAPPPGEGWNTRADDRIAGPGGGGEGLVHLGHQVVVGAGLVAHEHH